MKVDRNSEKKWSVRKVEELMRSYPEVVGKHIQDITHYIPKQTQDKKDSHDDSQLDPFFDKKSVEKWYRPKNIRLSETQYHKLFEGIEWTMNNNTPNLRINTNSDDKSNKGAMSVDTRVFGNREDMLYGDGTAHGKTATLSQLALSRKAAYDTFINVINYIKRGRKGVVFTDNNLPSITRTAIEKWLKNPNMTDEDIIAKATKALESYKQTSQTYMNTYDRVQRQSMAGNDEKIARYNLLTVPGTAVDCIALFTMTDFNFSDALKHGYLRQNGNTDKLLGIDKDERERENNGNLSNINITYDNGYHPNVKQNFSLYGYDTDNYDNGKIDHWKNSYQLQGSKYNTSEFGADDLQRELSKPSNYTTINQFLDKSVIYAKYALNEEDYHPDFIISVPSSSKFNQYYSINLSNKLGIPYIQNFFRKDILSVRFDGEDVYDRMMKEGFSEKEILMFTTQVKNVWMIQLENEIKQVVSNFIRQNADFFTALLGNLQKTYNKDLTMRDIVTNLSALCYESLRMHDIYSDMLTKYMLDNFNKLAVYNNEFKREILAKMKSLIPTVLGKRKFGELLHIISNLMLQNKNYLENKGIALKFNRKDFKITNFDKRFRPFLTGLYVIADENLNKNGELLNSFRNGKFLIVDEDINSGASFKLCIDALKQKLPNHNDKRIMCLANAYSASGR